MYYDTCTTISTYINFRSSSGLTWHQGAIPAEELSIKLGGDKGHGSFKFNFQLTNTEAPKLPEEHVSVFKAGDSTTNLHTALDMYKEHIQEMQGMKLKYATIIYIIVHALFH